MCFGGDLRQGQRFGEPLPHHGDARADRRRLGTHLRFMPSVPFSREQVRGEEGGGGFRVEVARPDGRGSARTSCSTTGSPADNAADSASKSGAPRWAAVRSTVADGMCTWIVRIADVLR
ncbi:hypothetical protein A4R43_00790 [Amycolatopsis albispora]|uniref:Uncharacterized protein n=1 Tax=Amycolatopsis albispora TaxID=1804986 RepID=A0A344KZK7_9PSEU|nr:hypothetical protein A4R43_00790 [Amycolatopsis albispora]